MLQSPSGKSSFLSASPTSQTKSSKLGSQVTDSHPDLGADAVTQNNYMHVLINQYVSLTLQITSFQVLPLLMH